MLQTVFPTSLMSEVAPMGLNFRRAMQSDAQPAAEPFAKPKKKSIDGRGMIGGRTGQEQIKTKSQLSNPPAPCFTDTGGYGLVAKFTSFPCELALYCFLIVKASHF